MLSLASRLTRRVVILALLLAPQLVRAQGKPPATPPTIIRGCQLVLNARNTGPDVVTVDLSASQAQEGTKAWRAIDGGAINQASAMTFTLSANTTSTRHTFTTWIDCTQKQRYQFSIRRGTKVPVMMEFPAGGSYTTDISMRLGDLAGPP